MATKKKKAEIKSLSALPIIGEKDMKVRVGLLFKKPAYDQDVGFDGCSPKDGVIVVKAGNTGTDDDFAKILRTLSARTDTAVQLGTRWIWTSPQSGRAVRPLLQRKEGNEEDRRPRLKTTVLYWLKTGCGCCPGRIIFPGDIRRCAISAGIPVGRDVVDVLNAGICPVCGKGEIEEWAQLDPFDPRAVALFDDLDSEGNLVGKSGEYRIEKIKKDLREEDSLFEKEFVPPGVVGLSRCAFGRDEEPEAIPSTDIYMRLQKEAHENVSGNGRPDPLRVDLLNCLDASHAILVGLNFCADEYTYGTADFSKIDGGFKSPEDANYCVSLRVFLERALHGEPPLLKSSATKPAPKKRHITLGGPSLGF